MTQPGRTQQEREESVIEWLQHHGRTLIIAAVVVALGAGVYWYYTRAQQLKDQAAERALNTALQSVQANNQALAQSDLRRVVDQYGDTQSGIEAGQLLAQIDFNAGKTDSGVAVLRELLAKGAANLDKVSIYSLIGDGQMQADKAKAAADSYQQAAAAATTDADRVYQQAKAARAFLVAGDTASAKTLWQALVNDPKAQGVAAEARVRLGEIEARPAPKG